MRCHYLSDLHLETQDFTWRLPHGDILIVAGDLGNASCLAPARLDLYSVRQRDRIRRFADAAVANFAHVLLVAGNHDHYGQTLDETIELLRSELPGVTVLDDEAIEIGGVQFFGTTLWSDFEGRSEACMDGLRRRVGDYFFIKTAMSGEGSLADGAVRLAKFRPEDALAAFDRAMAALGSHLARSAARRTVVVSHHAPSRHGCNPLHAGNGLDGAYASDLDGFIAALDTVPVWVHGHTHIQRTYRIGATDVRTNCRGFDGRDGAARRFSPNSWFEV